MFGGVAWVQWTGALDPLRCCHVSKNCTKIFGCSGSVFLVLSFINSMDGTFSGGLNLAGGFNISSGEFAFGFPILWEWVTYW